MRKTALDVLGQTFGLCLALAVMALGDFSRSVCAQAKIERGHDFSILLPSNHLGTITKQNAEPKPVVLVFLIRAGEAPSPDKLNIDYQAGITWEPALAAQRIPKADFTGIPAGKYSVVIQFGENLYQDGRLQLGTISVGDAKSYLMSIPPLVPVEIHIPIRESLPFFDPQDVNYIEVSGAGSANSWFLANRSVEVVGSELMSAASPFPAGQTFKVRVVRKMQPHYLNVGKFETTMETIQAGKVTVKEPAK